jgi:hypothetical protein
MPRGVEEVVMEAVLWGSETDRREGTRGAFEESGAGLVAGKDSSEEVWEKGLVGVSTVSSGVLAANALAGGVAMAGCKSLSS